MPPNEIANLWWSLWSLPNSPTCFTLNGNQLVPGADGASIDIARLQVPGKHKCLGLLYLLMVWREWVDDGEKNDWDTAVLDVHWITRRLCELMYYIPATEVIPTLKRYEYSH